MTSTDNIFRLKAALQLYDWGVQGSASRVARYAKNAIDSNFRIDENTHYAELWMGTHKNGPAVLWSDPSVSLCGLTTASPETFLGARLTRIRPDPAHPRLMEGNSMRPTKPKKAAHLPFLFKVLSIERVLPLQAHPDSKLAEDLFKRYPTQFVDSHHKPEIAIALEDGFQGFVGFKPIPEILVAVEDVPELYQAIDDPDAVRDLREKADSKSLKKVYTRLLTSSPENIKKLVAKLVGRVEVEGAQTVIGDEGITNLVLTLNKRFPGDVGVFAAPFFLKLITLNKGESVYIGADEVHAYLKGDIIECMAESDNVLNAAFVPPDKRNTQTFLHALTYTARAPSTYRLPPTSYRRSKTGRTCAFDPIFEEFTVLWTRLEKSVDSREVTWGALKKNEEWLEYSDGPTIGIVTRGTVEFVEPGRASSLTLEEGGVVFVKPLIDVNLRSVDAEAEIWWATCTETD